MSTVAVPGTQTFADLDRAAQMVSVGDEGWCVGETRCGPSAPDLADTLYERWYTLPATPAPAAPHDPPLHHRSLLGPLRAAHEGAGRVTNGWVVTAVNPAGGVVAAHGDRHRWAASGDYVTQTQPGYPPAPGQPVSVLDRLDHLDVERGLWWTFSDGALREPIGRVYVNTRAAAVSRLLREITGALADFTFCLKCSIHPHVYRRVDAMVIYHDRDARDAVVAALVDRSAALAPLLDPAVPPLTGLVRPGLSVADEVGDGRSYGEGRCHLLADAIAARRPDWTALNLAARREVLAAALIESGLDLEKPWQHNR